MDCAWAALMASTATTIAVRKTGMACSLPDQAGVLEWLITARYDLAKSQKTGPGRQNGRPRRWRKVAEEVVRQPDAHPSVHRITWKRLAKCGARTRRDGRCQGLAVNGRQRCRMHGGAPGSGAPVGNRNAWRHGRYSHATHERRALMHLLDAVNAAVDAELRVLHVVARGEVEVFEQAARLAEEQHEHVRRAAMAMEKYLIKAGQVDEARELAGEIAVLLRTEPNTTSGPVDYRVTTKNS